MSFYKMSQLPVEAQEKFNALWEKNQFWHHQCYIGIPNAAFVHGYISRDKEVEELKERIKLLEDKSWPPKVFIGDPNGEGV